MSPAAQICRKQVKIGSSSHLVKWLRDFRVCLKTGFSFGNHDAESKQIEFVAAVHKAFDRLQTVNMSFDRVDAAVVLKPGTNEISIKL